MAYFIVVAPPPPRKTRAELMKDIDADYYGYRDEDDGVIAPLEQEVEKKGMKFVDSFQGISNIRVGLL